MYTKPYSIRIALLVLLYGAFFLLSPHTIHVQAATLPGDFGTLQIPSVPQGGTNKLGQTINLVIYVLIVLGIVLAIAFLLYASVRWITSGGDKQKLESARKTVVFAIVGLIVVLWAFLIVSFLGNILTAPFLTSPGLP